MPNHPKTYTLNTGAPIPALGFGTFANDGAPGQTYTAVAHALRAGYRHLDCAWFYQNEAEVGAAVRDFLAATPAVTRADLFICTKVWLHLLEPEDVRWSLHNSLEKLQLDYVDLFLVHWPIAAEKQDDANGNPMPKLGPDGKYIINPTLTADLTPTWLAMESLQRSGHARAIGVSNWTIPGLQSLLSHATIPPAVNQIEIHPFLPNTPLVDFCLAHSILPAAYSPLGSQNQVPSTGEKVGDDATLHAVAARAGATVAQVCVAWGLRRGYVVLPKSSTPGRIESNAKLIELSEEDFEAVDSVARGRHTRFVNMKETFGYDVWPEESEG